MYVVSVCHRKFHAENIFILCTKIWLMINLQIIVKITLRPWLKKWGGGGRPSGPSGDYIPTNGWDVRRVTGSLTLSAPWLQTRICKLTFQKLLRGFAAQTVLRRLCLPLPAKIVFRRQNFGDFWIRFEDCEVTRRHTCKIRTLCKILQTDELVCFNAYIFRWMNT